MRIIAGTCKGRRLKSADIEGVRPTSDKVREAIFDILGDGVQGADILDLFAGFGAMGLEALSRGARFVVSVDKSRTAVKLIKENSAMLEISSIKIFCADVFLFLKHAPRKQELYDLIFLDPPYRMFEREWISDLWKGACRLMKESSVMIVEHPSFWESSESMGRMNRFCHKQYGQTSLSFFKLVKSSS